MKWGFAGAGLLATGLCAAAPLSAQIYTLEDAIEYALAHNPDALAAQAQTRAAGARTREAAGARLPELGVSYSARSSNDPLAAFADKLSTRRVTAADFDPARLNDPSASDLYNTQLALRMPLYAGELSADAETANELESSARLQYRRVREHTAFDTISAYRRLQAAQNGLAIAADAVAAARDHAATAGRLVREGRIVVSDRLTAELHLAATQSLREQAQTRVAETRSQLILAMGLPVGEQIEVVADVPRPTDIALGATGELETDALARRSDLQAMNAQLRAARSRIQAVRAAHKPKIDLLVTSNWYDDTPATDTHSWSVMGVISMDLYSGGRPSSRVEAAQYDARELELRTRRFEQGVRHEVRTAYDNVREAQARHAIAARNVERARENVRLIRQRYGQGRTILIDLLQAERTLVEMRGEELAALLKLNVGSAALRLATGTLEVAEESP